MKCEKMNAKKLLTDAAFLFLIGSLIMAYNLWMTVRVGEAEVQSPVALQPAE